MNSELNSSLWTFACGLYDFDEVKSQCLDLQNLYGANVDVILWLCWLDSLPLHTGKPALGQALQIVGGINQELLNGLRVLRAQLAARGSFTRVQEQLVRKHILAAELAIEKVVLQRLQDLSARLPWAMNDEESLTLFDYLDSLGCESAGIVAADLLAKSRSYSSMLNVEGGHSAPLDEGV